MKKKLLFCCLIFMAGICFSQTQVKKIYSNAAPLMDNETVSITQYSGDNNYYLLKLRDGRYEHIYEYLLISFTDGEELADFLQQLIDLFDKETSTIYNVKGYNVKVDKSMGTKYIALFDKESDGYSHPRKSPLKKALNKLKKSM